MFLLLISGQFSGHIRFCVSIFLYRNTLQGMGYGLVPMLGGVFELVARTELSY